MCWQISMGSAAQYSPIELATSDPDEFTEGVAAIAPGISVGAIHKRAFGVCVTGFPLPHVSLMRVRCRNFRVRDKSGREYVAVTMALTTGFQVHESRVEDYMPGSAHVLRSSNPFDLRADDCPMLVANIDAGFLSALALNLTGRQDAVETNFASRLRLNSRHGGEFWRAVTDLWRTVDGQGGAISSPLALREWQTSIATELLLADDLLRKQLERPYATSRHLARLKRVEDWIIVHLEEPLSRADICAVAGLDVRTLSRAFRRSYGMGPMEFVRARRLDAVNRILLGLEPGDTTVTEVAMTYGFHHLSRFAADYQRTFGELPSQTLKQ